MFSRAPIKVSVHNSDVQDPGGGLRRADRPPRKSYGFSQKIHYPTINSESKSQNELPQETHSQCGCWLCEVAGGTDERRFVGRDKEAKADESVQHRIGQET